MTNDSRTARYGIAAVLAGLAFVASCSAQPENPAAGTCTLSCSSPKAGSSDMVLAATQNTTIAQFCTITPDASGKTNPIQPTSGPIKVSFLLSQTIATPIYVPGSATTGGGTATGGGATGGTTSGLSLFNPNTPILNSVPVGGIGFQPNLQGNVAVEKTNPEFVPTAGSASPFQFAGVVTPSAEWCSDSCGVISYEFWPLCRQANSMTVAASVSVDGVVVPAAAAYSYTSTNN